MSTLGPRPLPAPTGFVGLPFGGQLSLWAVRLWMNDRAGHPALHRTLRTGFTLVGLAEAHIALDRFLTIVDQGDRRVFGSCRCNDPHITPEERVFLTCLAHHQQGCVVAAYQGLLTWIGPNLTRLAMAPLLDYALLLSARNLQALAIETPGPCLHTLSRCGCETPASPAGNRG